MAEIKIRTVTEADAAELLEIYAPYVTDTVVTYEYEVPTVEEFCRRIADTRKQYPYFAAVQEGKIIGYAYASAFHPRAAYRWSAEATVYLRMEERGKGVGQMLYRALEEALKRQNVENINACIAYPNPQSIAFHEKMGYHAVGKFTDCAYKLGEWLGMVWMEKTLGTHPNPPRPFRPYPEIAEEKGTNPCILRPKG